MKPRSEAARADDWQLKVQTMKAKSIIITTALAGIAFALVLVAGCAQKTELGQPIPGDAKSAKLADIMQNPAAYKNKEVMLTGNYAGHCCPTDFNYKEGVHAVECYYPGFKVPETKPGRPVKIYGVVQVRQEEGAKEAQVHVEAKGVEFK